MVAKKRKREKQSWVGIAWFFIKGSSTDAALPERKARMAGARTSPALEEDILARLRIGEGLDSPVMIVEVTVAVFEKDQTVCPATGLP